MLVANDLKVVASGGYRFNYGDGLLVVGNGRLMLKVWEEFRGQGLGTIVCEEVLKLARTDLADCEVSAILMTIRNENGASRRMAEKAGWRAEEEPQSAQFAVWRYDVGRFRGEV